MKCAYCGHPEHYGERPASITKSRAAELWAARGPQQSIAPTAAECETIMQVWDRLPGDASYASAFFRIRGHGSAWCLAMLRPCNPGPYQPRMLVTCGYRDGHVGRVLALDDPRAWAGSLAFPESNPDREAVRWHVARCGKLLHDGKVPVLWTFKNGRESYSKVYWDSQLSMCSRERAAWYDWHENANAPVIIFDYQQGQLALCKGAE